MNRVNWGIKLSIAVCMLVAPAAFAQYESDFDSLSASADGTVLTGQDGYYIPPATTSTDFEVYTYAANSLRLPQNPTGGSQFIAGIGQAGSPLSFERAQRDMPYGTGTWTAAFDIAATYTGQLPSAQNLGSFSIQPFPGSANFIALARWADPATASAWNADYVWFDANDTQLTESVPDPNFQDLAIDHWYRWGTTFNLDTNQITEVSLTDLTTGDVFTHNPVDRYLDGGAAGGEPTPTGFRFFAGGSVPGNTLAFDNPSIVPEPATLVLLGLGGLALIRRR